MHFECPAAGDWPAVLSSRLGTSINVPLKITPSMQKFQSISTLRIIEKQVWPEKKVSTCHPCFRVNWWKRKTKFREFRSDRFPRIE